MPLAAPGAYAKLTAVTGGVEFASSYDAGLVAAFKARVPAEARRFDGRRKVWTVAPEFAKVCAELALEHLGVECAVPKYVAAGRTESRLVELMYLGRCKLRGGESSALGWGDGGWNVLIPEATLRSYFGQGEGKQGTAPTLYGVLGVTPTADTETIRAGYRRMARQWHPDVCREADAADRFRAIKRAYDVLIDPATRRKYEAGLALEASVHQRQERYEPDGYRSPLRCGMVLGEGKEVLGRFEISRIDQWEDIEGEGGKVMVVSWPMGADQFVVEWR